MKVKKLVKIILVAPSYIIVDNDGNNQLIYLDTSNKKIGDFYEMELEIKSDETKIEEMEGVEQFDFEEDGCPEETLDKCIERER